MTTKYDILSLSTGDLLRQHIAEKYVLRLLGKGLPSVGRDGGLIKLAALSIYLPRTEVGKAAEPIVASGGLLPDEIMLKVVTTKLDHLHNKV